MQLKAKEISELIQQRIAAFSDLPKIEHEGTILSIGDGVVYIQGLASVKLGELIGFPNGQFGMALNLERDVVGAIVLGPFEQLSVGMNVRGTGSVLSVPVGPGLLGRVINALGQPIDGLGPCDTDLRSPIEREAPGVLDRLSVRKPLQTGCKSIDAMIPIGRGQRELIIGDRQLGKTTIALDTILNQRNQNMKCIYVAIGQKASTVAQVVQRLRDAGALAYTTVVSASAAEPAALQYIAPYAACAMGEYYRDRGEDALVVYDDLSKHAVAYRQLSLLLRRPPGREAFPGDVFYLHSRLLERAACVNATYLKACGHLASVDHNASGSLTALPILETQAGDISGFVATNVISITDGQIFLDSTLFNRGIRPAVEPGISVSRIGGTAQHPVLRKLTGELRTALSQYQELQSFAQFSSDLDQVSLKQLEKGKQITALLRQRPFDPISLPEQIVIWIALQEGYLENLALGSIPAFCEALLRFVKTEGNASFREKLQAAQAYDQALVALVVQLLETFSEQAVY